ncbi:MAG: DUF6161 domain-containing protein [Chlorobiales bacterium]|nr:DUF6161 domain-containing protein [Chlorobiales bacterium]
MNDKNKEFEFVFLPGRPEEKKFLSVDELRGWREKEREYWKWLDKVPRDAVSSVQAIRNKTGKLFKPIDSLLNKDKEQIMSYVDQMQGEVNTFLYHNRMIYSSSPEAKFLDGLDKKKAAHAASALLGNQPEPHSDGSFEGAFLAYAFMYGYVKRDDAESLSVRKHLEEWQILLDTSKNDFTAQKSEVSKLLQRYSNYFEKQERESLKLRKERKIEFDNLIASSKSELGNIEKTYNDKLALQSSVKYWEEKGVQHKKLSVLFSFLSSMLAVIIAVLLYAEIRGVVGLEQRLVDLPVWKISMVILTAVIGVWALRIFVRLLLSNLHLMTDAQERRTMLMTYLALLREGHGPTEEQKELILQTLFRPSATGIVKDDGIPSVMAKWVNTITN